MRYKKFMFSWFIYLKFITYCLLPFVIILVLNILIVARLRWTPHTLRPGMLGSNPGVSIGLEASTVMMTDGRYTTSSSTVRTANTTPSTSASSSAIALRQRQQVSQPEHRPGGQPTPPFPLNFNLSRNFLPKIQNVGLKVHTLGIFWEKHNIFSTFGRKSAVDRRTTVTSWPRDRWCQSIHRDFKLVSH